MNRRQAGEVRPIAMLVASRSKMWRWGARGRACAALAGVAAMTAVEGNALANPEFNVAYDARATAMGGSALTLTESGAAIVQNPARMSEVESVTITASATPFFARTRAPFAGPGSEIETDLATVPLFLVGGAVRVHERVVVGAGAYTASGAGANYDNIPALGGQSIELAVGILEFAVPVAVAITDEVSVGAAARFGFADQSASQPDPSGATISQDLSGADAMPAVTLSGMYQPAPGVDLAVLYRSKLTVGFDGTTTIGTPMGSMELGTTTEWSTPHQVQAGGAFRLLDRRLLVATEAVVSFYEDANESQELYLEGNPMPTSVPLNWQTTLQAKAGVEYMVAENLALRGGYTVGNSATPADQASPMAPPPGLMQQFGAGAGYRLGTVAIDVAGALMMAGDTVESSENGSPGEYDGTAGTLALSVTYRR